MTEKIKKLRYCLDKIAGIANDMEEVLPAYAVDEFDGEMDAAIKQAKSQLEAIRCELMSKGIIC